MHPDFAHHLCERVVIREARTAVAVPAERFRRKEARAADRPERPGCAPAVRRTEALRGILDDRHAASRRDLGNRVIVSALTEQIHGHDRLRLVRERRLDQRRIDIERARIDVDEYGRRAGERDHPGRRNERERRRHHLVAGTDTERHQRDEQRIRAARHCDAMARSRERRETTLELRDLRTHDVLPVLQHCIDARTDRAGERRVLRLQIDEFHRRLRCLARFSARSPWHRDGSRPSAPPRCPLRGDARPGSGNAAGPSSSHRRA